MSSGRQAGRNPAEGSNSGRRNSESPSAFRPAEIPNRTGAWTLEQHRHFLRLYQVYKKDWKRIARFIGGRTSEQVRSHAQKYFLKEQRRKQQRIATQQALNRIQSGEGRPQRDRRQTQRFRQEQNILGRRRPRRSTNKKRGRRK